MIWLLPAKAVMTWPPVRGDRVQVHVQVHCPRMGAYLSRALQIATLQAVHRELFGTAKKQSESASSAESTADAPSSSRSKENGPETVTVRSSAALIQTVDAMAPANLLAASRPARRRR